MTRQGGVLGPPSSTLLLVSLFYPSCLRGDLSVQFIGEIHVMLIPLDKKSTAQIAPEHDDPVLGELVVQESVVYPIEKEGVVDEALDTETYNQNVPSVSTSSAPLHGPAISFQIYKGDGFFNLDSLVKSENKRSIEYYLERPRRLLVLDLTLHAASKTGPRIATMLRTGWSRLFNVTLLKDGFTTEITWDVHGAEQHFLGRDGKKMMWKNDHLALNGDWLCLNEEDPFDIAARWQCTPLARKKQGKCNIMPNYVDQTDLILATGLAVEEWGRETRRLKAMIS